MCNKHRLCFSMCCFILCVIIMFASCAAFKPRTWVIKRLFMPPHLLYCYRICLCIFRSVLKWNAEFWCGHTRIEFCDCDMIVPVKASVFRYLGYLWAVRNEREWESELVCHIFCWLVEEVSVKDESGAVALARTRRHPALLFPLSYKIKNPPRW